jgi:pimeloyl-ACP methyl ester carboxylesterase
VERWLDAARTRIFARVYGDGAPVLYWHGIGLRSRASLTLECAPALAERGLRIVAVDVPGWGRSPPLDRRRYAPTELADLAAAALDALEVDRAAFMGFSWGADVGLHVAASHPDRLTSLVLLDAGYSDPPLDAGWPFERFLAEVEEQWQPGNTPAEVVAAAEFGMAQATLSRSRTEVAASGLPILLIVAGDAPQAELSSFETEAQHAEIIRVPGAGHDVLADGGPEVVERLADWLVVHA